MRILIKALWLAIICVLPRIVLGEGQSAVVLDDVCLSHGPIKIREQHPFSLYHLSFTPEAPHNLSPGATRFRTALTWSSTLNRKSGKYRIDAETRLLELEAEYAPARSFRLGVNIPILWRGAGILDSSLDHWHQALGLPRGDRDVVPDDEFAIRGQHVDGSRFDLDTQGTRLGNLVFDGQYVFSELSGSEQSWAGLLKISLPTAQNAYAHDGLDVGAGLLYSSNWNWLTSYFGLGYAYYSDQQFHELQFKAHHFSSFLHFEKPVFEELPLSIGVFYASPLVKDIKQYPEYALYLDLGVRFAVGQSAQIELLLRENLAPQAGTTDLSVLVALSMVAY